MVGLSNVFVLMECRPFFGVCALQMMEMVGAQETVICNICDQRRKVICGLLVPLPMAIKVPRHHHRGCCQPLGMLSKCFANHFGITRSFAALWLPRPNCNQRKRLGTRHRYRNNPLMQRRSLLSNGPHGFVDDRQAFLTFIPKPDAAISVLL